MFEVKDKKTQELLLWMWFGYLNNSPPKPPPTTSPHKPLLTNSPPKSLLTTSPPKPTPPTWPRKPLSTTSPHKPIPPTIPSKPLPTTSPSKPPTTTSPHQPLRTTSPSLSPLVKTKLKFNKSNAGFYNFTFFKISFLLFLSLIFLNFVNSFKYSVFYNNSLFMQFLYYTIFRLDYFHIFCRNVFNFKIGGWGLNSIFKFFLEYFCSYIIFVYRILKYK